MKKLILIKNSESFQGIKLNKEYKSEKGEIYRYLFYTHKNTDNIVNTYIEISRLSVENLYLKANSIWTCMRFHNINDPLCILKMHNWFKDNKLKLKEE